MPKATTPAHIGRDIILVDEGRYPLWLAATRDLAERRGSTEYDVLQVRDPTPTWFEGNGLAVPDAEHLKVFRSSGIVFLPSWHRPRVLNYAVDKFARIAVASCLAEAVMLQAGRPVTLAQLGGSIGDLAEQRRLAGQVLEEFDGLAAEARAIRFEAAFLNDSETAVMHLRFEDLRTNHRAVWLEQLDGLWQRERGALARMAAIDHT